MNPAVFAGVLVAMLASSSGSKQQPQAPVSAGAVVAVLIWTILGPAWFYELGLVLETIGRGAWGEAAVALGFFLATSIVLFPWPIARRILIPLGQVRLAWAVTRLSFWAWRRDVRNGAVIAGAWAAIRRAQAGPDGSLAPELLTWLEARRDQPPRGTVRWRTGGAGIVATGLLAEARGDRATARRLLSSALELAEPTRPPTAIELASAWLAAEAMERGAWREVEFLARTAPLRTRRLLWFGGVAARVTGIAPLPSDAKLIALWLLAPGRVAGYPLLRRALATPAAPPRPTSRVQAPARGRAADTRDPWLAALELHADTLARDPGELGRDDLVRLGAAWDEAFADPELSRRLIARGVALGSHAQDPAPLAARVRDDLLALVRAAGLELGPLSETSEVLGRAARELHGELLDGLEISANALEARVRAQREHPAVDEWQAFLGVREQYADAVAVGGLELRRLAFQAVHAAVCALAVWLWNTRSERAIANAMFHWLLAEAIIVDDAEAIRLQERNVDCGV